MTPSATWWRGAVVYQVYLRSFADGNGDGLGDLAGLRSRLPYLVDLGVDAIWINPWYPSPMVDAGYDVSDYRSVDPRFGTLADAEALLAEAHQAGLRVLLDIVPNHTSDQHPWFQAALAAGPGSPERERYLFRPGQGHGEGLPDLAGGPDGHPAWDRDEVHQIYREWRAIADAYLEPRVFVAEAWVDQPERLARYVRPDELHTAFNFFFLTSPWRAASLRQAIDETLVEHAAVGAPPTWVLSDHDTARHLSRYARQPTSERGINLRHLLGRPADLALGTRRARAAALLLLALPGGAYVYQGEELGLPEVEDLPVKALDDPVWERSGRTDRGRDGCRVPIPWEGGGPPYGFSPPAATAPPWLPQPPGWDDLAVAVQSGDRGSMLELYRAALGLRRGHPALGDGTLRWLEAPAGALAFARDPGFACLVNVSGPPAPLPAGAAPLLASGPLTPEGAVPEGSAVWLRR